MLARYRRHEQPSHVLTLELGLLIASVVCQKPRGGDASENARCRLRYGGNRKATPNGRARTLKECTLLINHHGRKKKSFQKEAPKLRSVLSSTTGRKFLVTADIFSLQQLDVSKSDL